MDIELKLFSRLVINVVGLFYGLHAVIVVQAILNAPRIPNSQHELCLAWQTDDQLADVVQLSKKRVRAILDMLLKGRVVQCVAARSRNRNNTAVAQGEARDDESVVRGWGIDFNAFVDTLDFRLHQMESILKMATQQDCRPKFHCRVCGLELDVSRLSEAVISPTGQTLCPSRRPECAQQELEETTNAKPSSKMVDHQRRAFKFELAHIRQLLQDVNGAQAPVFRWPRPHNSDITHHQDVPVSDAVLDMPPLKPDVPWFATHARATHSSSTNEAACSTDTRPEAASEDVGDDAWARTWNLSPPAVTTQQPVGDAAEDCQEYEDFEFTIQGKTTLFSEFSDLDTDTQTVEQQKMTDDEYNYFFSKYSEIMGSL